jgi:hypothetical protein
MSETLRCAKGEEINFVRSQMINGPFLKASHDLLKLHEFKKNPHI